MRATEIKQRRFSARALTYVGEDGVTVIEVETDGTDELPNGQPRVRVYVNDGLVFGEPLPVDEPLRGSQSES